MILKELDGDARVEGTVEIADAVRGEE